MAQILDPIPNGQRNFLLCCYVNSTSQIQIARITNIPNWYFERVVFPGQRLVFEALSNALLEIHTGMMTSAILSDTIPCERLCMSQGDDDEINANSAPVSEKNNNKQNIETIDHQTQEIVTSFAQVLVAAS